MGNDDESDERQLTTELDNALAEIRRLTAQADRLRKQQAELDAALAERDRVHLLLLETDAKLGHLRERVRELESETSGSVSELQHRIVELARITMDRRVSVAKARSVFGGAFAAHHYDRAFRALLESGRLIETGEVEAHGRGRARIYQLVEPEAATTAANTASEPERPDPPKRPTGKVRRAS